MGIHQLLLGGGGEIVVVISATATNLNASTLFGTNYGAGVAKRLIINSGVTIGGTSAATPALTIPTGLAGSLLIDNYGSIQGAGGAAGTSGVGGDGGNAILAQAACRIINNAGATIYGGGGGGGQGGTGGTGGGGTYGYVSSLGVGNAVSAIQSNCTNSCNTMFGSGAYCASDCRYYSNTAFGPRVQCYGCARNETAYTSGGGGGAGGAGGRGQGYNQALATGSAGAGGAAGGTNAGAGGTGGTGGSGASWGTAGTSGNTGGTGANGNNGGGAGGAAGSAGGLAGFYINGLSTFVTLTNSGTVAGRTN